VTLKNLPPNEYEVAVCRPERSTQKIELERRSNTLRLDVLAAAPRTVNGLTIDLARAPSDVRATEGRTALRATFTNDGKRPMCFEISCSAKGRELAANVVAYDAKGTLLQGALSRAEDFRKDGMEAVRLEHGGTLKIDVEVPNETALARVVWMCSRSDADETKGDFALPLDWYASQHVRLTPR
jgi:hypothetical protein